jgi:hypothetical protein
MEGISSRHGGHHVAQKLRKTTLPCNDDKRTSVPDKSLSEKSGACIPSLATEARGVSLPFSFEQPGNNRQNMMISNAKDLKDMLGSSDCC